MHDWLYPMMAARLRQGAVVAYPTEAVWGLGCDPFNQTAVERLLEIKNRPVAKGVILISGQVSDFAPWLEALDDQVRARILASWPGPNTWLVPDPCDLPRWIKGDHAKVALRCSAHPTVAALCRHFGGPIISTSANPATRPPARSAAQVRRYFGGALDGLVPGPLGGLKQPTTIRDALTGDVVRP